MKRQIQSKYLMMIKKIIDEDKNGDKFIVIRTNKNKNFIKEYGLTYNSIKNIIRDLSIDDCFSGPELDRNENYEGAIFKFNPTFEDIKLYIKIRIEDDKKTICISIHEYGLHDEVN